MELNVPTVITGTFSSLQTIPATTAAAAAATAAPTASLPAVVCLVLVVRAGDAPVIERCLRAVDAHVSLIHIISADGGEAVSSSVLRFLKAKSGNSAPRCTLHNAAWTDDMGALKTLACQQARELYPQAQWLLVLNAHEVLDGTMINLPDVLGKLPPNVGFCEGTVAAGSTCSQRALVFAAKVPWTFIGPLHELAVLPASDDGAAVARGKCILPPILFVTRDERDGWRSRQPSLHAAAARQLDAYAHPLYPPSRAVFYAGIEWLAAGNAAEAQARFLRRMAMPEGSPDERYMAATFVVTLAADLDTALRAAWLAAECNPARLEAAALLMSRVQQAPAASSDGVLQQVFALGLHAFAVGSKIALPRFFMSEQTVYAYAFADEFSVVAHRAGYKAIALQAAKAALAGLPEDADAGMRVRIQANVDAMAPPASASASSPSAPTTSG